MPAQRSRCPFPETAKQYFQFLLDEFHFELLSQSDESIYFSTADCRIGITEDRGGIFVSISSLEASNINRLRISLEEIIRTKDPERSLPNLQDTTAWQTDVCAFRHRYLHEASQLVRQYCADLLAGDFSLRPIVIQARVKWWLNTWFDHLMVTAKYRTQADALRQLKQEYSGYTKEYKQVIWTELEDWLTATAQKKKAFAELLIENL